MCSCVCDSFQSHLTREEEERRKVHETGKEESEVGSEAAGSAEQKHQHLIPNGMRSKREGTIYRRLEIFLINELERWRSKSRREEEDEKEKGNDENPFSFFPAKSVSSSLSLHLLLLPLVVVVGSSSVLFVFWRERGKGCNTPFCSLPFQWLHRREREEKEKGMQMHSVSLFLFFLSLCLISHSNPSSSSSSLSFSSQCSFCISPLSSLSSFPSMKSTVPYTSFDSWVCDDENDDIQRLGGYERESRERVPSSFLVNVVDDAIKKHLNPRLHRKRDCIYFLFSFLSHSLSFFIPFRCHSFPRNYYAS